MLTSASAFTEREGPLMESDFLPPGQYHASPDLNVSIF
jgi:hypothetical protein